jgi:hypothetical protein
MIISVEIVGACRASEITRVKEHRVEVWLTRIEQVRGL